MDNTTAQPPDQADPPLWDTDAFGQTYPMSLGSDQQVGALYAMTTQPFLADHSLPDMHGFVPQAQTYTSPYFTASAPHLHSAADNTQHSTSFDFLARSYGPDPAEAPPPEYNSFGQQTSASAGSQDPAGRRRTTCPVCSETKGSSRDLDRHLWTHHRDYAAQNRVRSEERQCPHPHCTYVGRKDNLSRHIKTRHKSS